MGLARRGDRRRGDRNLHAARGFAHPGPTATALLGYTTTFAMLALRTLSLSIAYAYWSRAGIALNSLVGWLVYGQWLDLLAVAGLALIVADVLVIYVFSSIVPD